MSGIIIDHSNTPAKRSTGNVARLGRRLRSRIKDAVNEAANNGKLQDMSKGFKARIKGLGQPSFHHNPSTGTWRRVFPGNDDFTPGDLIDKPKGGGGSGSKQAGTGDDAEDDFVFDVPTELARELLLEDLELPDLVKTQMANTTSVQIEREGYASSGPPSNLSMTATARKAVGRRIGLKRPKQKELDALQQEIDTLKAKPEKTAEDEKAIADLQHQWDALKRKRRAIPFVDIPDLRFRRFEQHPKPITQAVMFCLMDVSASMGEHEKDLAKRFFYLLHLFLSVHYQTVKLVFIRHTEHASEVDEQEFFFGKKSGGTVASSALELMLGIIQERFPRSDWNIYGCQCSDGDAYQEDAFNCVQLLEGDILPLVQYFAYLEVGERNRNGGPLWHAYQGIEAENFAYDAAFQRNEIYPVFRRFFEAPKKQRVA